MTTKRLILICSSIALFGILMFSAMMWTILDDKKTLEETKIELAKEQGLRTTCSISRDSLTRINFELSKYKTLTLAMINRDEVTKQLKYKIGQLVYLKNDSSRVVIEDVLIGGGKYNYYVKYRVLLKDNTSREIVPELIY